MTHFLSKFDWQLGTQSLYIRTPAFRLGEGYVRHPVPHFFESLHLCVRPSFEI